MLEIDEVIPVAGISEPYLIDTIRNMKKNCSIKGIFPPYGKKIYDEYEPGKFDFTNSFLFYMAHNRHLLNFAFDIVTSPAYVVYYIDQEINYQSHIPNVSYNMGSETAIVQMRKLPVQATMEFLRQGQYYSFSMVFDEILSDMNNLMAHKHDRAVYVFKLLAQEHNARDAVDFMLRFGISRKGMTVVKPNGPLPNPSTTNNPFKTLGMTVEDNPWIKILDDGRKYV